MLKMIPLLVLFGASAAMASPPEYKSDAAQQSVRDSAEPTSARDADALMVTGVRPRNFDLTAPDFVTFRSTAARTMSSPPSLDLVTEPVLVTLRTGNTEQLHQKRFSFPFENVQDRTVRDSDVLKIRLAKFKLD